MMKIKYLQCRRSKIYCDVGQRFTAVHIRDSWPTKEYKSKINSCESQKFTAILEISVEDSSQ